MNRIKTNIIIDILMLLAMASVSISGWVIKYFLPLGGRMRHRSYLVSNEFMGMERCTWRDIHLWSGIALIILLVLHVVLHWNFISAFFKKHIPNNALRNFAYAFLLIISLISVVPWIIFGL